MSFSIIGVRAVRCGDQRMLPPLPGCVLLLVAACSGSSEDAGASVGALGGPCTSGGSCDRGLVCSDGVCEKVTNDPADAQARCPEGQLPADCEVQRDRCDCGPEPDCDSCNGAPDYARCYDACTGSYQRCRQDCTTAYEDCSANPPCVACNTDEDCAEPLVCREVVNMTGAGAETSVLDCAEPTNVGSGGVSSAGGTTGAGGESGGGGTGGAGGSGTGGSGADNSGGSGAGGSGGTGAGGSGAEGSGADGAGAGSP